jgi:hypothetical protein
MAPPPPAYPEAVPEVVVAEAAPEVAPTEMESAPEALQAYPEGTLAADAIFTRERPEEGQA